MILTIIKYTYSLVLMLVAYYMLPSEKLILVQLFELVALFFLFNSLVKRHKRLARILNAIVMLMFNIQLLLMIFSRSYLSLIMLSNLTLINDVSGMSYVYIPNILILVLISILPINHISEPGDIVDRLLSLVRKRYSALVVILSILVSIGLGAERSPYISYVKLGIDGINNYKKSLIIKNNEEKYAKQLEEMGVDPSDSGMGIGAEFYKNGIESGFDEEVFKDKPNVIYIITEGLSQSVIDDGRGIMPNIRYYQSRSLNFTNYFDHTAATYRALVGQLFSGHQYNNHDVNKLISLMDVLRDNGYKSVMINSEPNLPEFTDYLGKLGFDELISTPGEYEGDVNQMSDKEVYELLKDEVIKCNEEKEPYMLTVYTFGTHFNLSSPHLQYGDGSSIVLNRFYNADYWFGEFMEWFDNAGEITDNTLLVFTSDHAAYALKEWYDAFPSSQRMDVWVDRIPCFFYHKGISPSVVDVEGRNCINIAPTILDYINVGEDHYNFFLGNSLFLHEPQSDLESLFYCAEHTYAFDTKGGEIKVIDGRKLENILERINLYFALKNVGIKK